MKADVDAEIYRSGLYARRTGKIEAQRLAKLKQLDHDEANAAKRRAHAENAHFSADRLSSPEQFVHARR